MADINKIIEDFDKDIDENNDGFDYDMGDSELEYEDLDSPAPRQSRLLVGQNDRVVHEIRKSPKYEEIFRVITAAKNIAIEKKSAELEASDKEATKIVKDNAEGLIETESNLEVLLGKEIERIDYYTYAIDGLELQEEDLALKSISQAEYDECLRETIKNRRAVKDLDKEIRKVKIAGALSFRRHSSADSEGYYLDCIKTDKEAKLIEGETFLKKCDFINSLSSAELTQLRMLLEKSRIVGDAVETLKKDEIERTKLADSEGQSLIVKDICEKYTAANIIQKADYDELIKFIQETKQKVSVKEYDSSEVGIDNSDIGITIYGFVSSLEDLDREKSMEELFKKLRETQEIKVEEEVKPLEFEKLERSEETEKEPEQPSISKDSENNMIVSFVLENEKFNRVAKAIRDEERDLFAEARTKINIEIDKAYKNENNSARYIKSEMTELPEALNTEITVENGECHFGNLLITAGDLELANYDEERYEEQLETLDKIKKAEREVNRDINRIRRKERFTDKHSYFGEITLHSISIERDKILDDKEEVSREIKITEFFANLPDDLVRRTCLFIEAADLEVKSQQKSKELTTKLIELETPPYRQPIMEKALLNCVKAGTVSKEDARALRDFIKTIQIGVETGRYKYVDDYERNDSDLGLVVYDYIDLLERKMKEKKEVQPQKTEKDLDDDGDIIL